MSQLAFPSGRMGGKRIVSVAMLAAVAMWGATTAMAQSASPKPGNMAKDADPGWEAVTVKPSDPNDKFDVMTTRGRHIVIRNNVPPASRHDVKLIVWIAWLDGHSLPAD